MRKLRAVFVLGMFAIGGGQSAHAGDGVLEINQACAVNTGCFPGDTPGFPVEISAPGSYRLTSNLQVPANSAGINAGGAFDVRVDLGNFEIVGPGTCSGSGATLTCTGTGVGAIINKFGELSNGTVRGFEYGVNGSPRIHAITARENHIGFLAFNIIASAAVADGNQLDGFNGGGTYRDCVATGNGGVGFQADPGSVLLAVRARANGAAGIRLRGAGVVRDSVVDFNGAEGINAVSGVTASGLGAVIEGNTVSQNATDGIVVGPGSLVARNVARSNGAAGISALSSSSVQGNVATANGVYGLYLVPENGGTAAAYRDNFVTGSPNSVAGGINMGGNSCNGTTTCP